MNNAREDGVDHELPPVDDQNNPAILVGVCVTDERNVNRLSSDSCILKTDTVLGTLVIKNDAETISALSVRKLMNNQIQSLPPCYIFLSSDGWPISQDQEKDVVLKHFLTNKSTIRIRRNFAKPRVGVRSSDGITLGFIFAESTCFVRQLREAIDAQLCESIKFHSGDSYRFIERNGWPLTCQQELQLTVIDVLIGHNVCIEFGGAQVTGRPLKTIPTPFQTPGLLPEHPAELNSPTIPPPTPSFHLPVPRIGSSQDSTDSVEHEHWSVKKKKTRKFKTLDQLSFRTVKDFERKKAEKDMGIAKPILISYVRAESAQNALDLKRELCDLGFSVYLDVHEIKTGIDWQDALNFAVSNCEVFVPLVTPRYGQTQWTNREVKLADVLSKFIIPVNFLENWPPECLAIQFASTQYIQWRIQTDIDQGDCQLDTQGLDRVSCRRVASEIAVRCKVFKKHSRQSILRNNLSIFNKKSTSLRSPSEDVPEKTIASIMEADEDETDSTLPLVVISVHPKQKALAHELKMVLEDKKHDDQKFRVWCSVEVNGALNGNELRPPSSESGNAITQTYHDINQRIAESKASSTVSWADQCHTFQDKTPLTFQDSLISQVSSLTPEKIERLRTFQQKADEAEVVVIVVSDAYTKSKTCQQQVYYCEHRKKVLAVKYDQSDVPGWFQMLIGNDMVKNISNPQFMDTFRARIRRAVDPSSSSPPKDATTEAKMQYLVNFLQKNIPTVDDSYIYISGSTKVNCSRSEDICKAIGLKLALSGDLHVVTGGYYGVAELVAQTYINQQKHYESSVFHLLPMKDTKDIKHKTRQNADGSFQPVPFGKTIFLGDSIKERELAVARLFSTCVLIAGGPASAQEAEQFIWNDHSVIPIISTGGAAGGMYGIPAKIFEVQPGVSIADWELLSKSDASPDQVADAVIRIIRSLKTACSSGTPSNEGAKRIKSRLKDIGKSKNINDIHATLFDDVPERPKSAVRSFVGNVFNVFKKKS